MNFDITIKRTDTKSKVMVSKNATSSEQAWSLAMKDRKVLDFLSGYDGFYSTSIISQEAKEKAELSTFPKLSFN